MKIVYDYMMSQKNITVIVPRLPPAIDGLGDYGLLLSRELKDKHSIQSRFIVCDPNWSRPFNNEEFEIKVTAKREKQVLLKLLEQTDILLLHYVGYGYAKRGCPLWLMEAILDWKKNKNKKLITMVHECYAFGPPWTSQFWTSPLQRYILQKLTSVSTHLLTSKKSYANIIKKYSGKKTVYEIPVFSNVGEIQNFRQLDLKENVAVVFGSKAWRKKVYAENEDLKKLVNHLEIKKIMDIGSPVDVASLKDIVDVEQMGNLSSDEISIILNQSRYGIINYPEAYLAKSGIFASYCAHGLLPISFYSGNEGTESVMPGVHFLPVKDVLVSNSLQRNEIAEKAHGWYMEHSIEKQAKLYDGLIRSEE